LKKPKSPALAKSILFFASEIQANRLPHVASVIEYRRGHIVLQR